MRVDHIYVELAEARTLFEALTTRLGLPVAWPFREVTPGFASGGVSLGDLIVEFVQPDQVKAGPEYGIALAEARPRLRVVGLDTAPDEENFGGDTLLWVSADIPDLSGPGLSTFVCDYTTDPLTWQRRCRDELAAGGGGPLGIVGVSEVVVESAGPTRQSWASLGLDQPHVRCVPGLRHGLRELVVQVRDPDGVTEAFARLVPQYVESGVLPWRFVSAS
jgi:hypothetical protein